MFYLTLIQKLSLAVKAVTKLFKVIGKPERLRPKMGEGGGFPAQPSTNSPPSRGLTKVLLRRHLKDKPDKPAPNPEQ